MAYTDIDKPDDYFNTILYTGDATDDRSITGVGFQPDFSWVKRRDSVGSHRLKDSVRGATKTLISNGTNAESTEANVFQAFESDGFQLGSDSALNASGGTYASWNWLASNTTASNTDGSITSTVSANTTSGFSIVSWTGTGSTGTIGHGLGSAPNFVIIKCRSEVRSWVVTNTNLGFTGRAFLEATDAWGINSGEFNDTAPTSSVFTVGGDFRTNRSGQTYIAYLFKNIKGFSKTGTYTGNGSTDGTFVYLGFKPAWVMLKRTGSAGGWVMFDNKRNSFNVMDETLLANVSDAETVYANQIFDFVSNGLKVRGTANSSNASGSTYLYMAFAENPFVTSTGIPACAR